MSNEKLPIFRLIHKEEANHHAEIVCKKRGIRKGSKKYNETYNKAFLQYIKDAQESLYPSGEIEMGTNPQQEYVSTLEKLRRRSPLYGKLTKQEYDRLIASKEWKYLSKVSELKHDYDTLFKKHIKRGSKAPSELEQDKMKKVERRLINHLKKENSVEDAKFMCQQIVKQSPEKFQVKYTKLMKQLIKEVI